MHDRIQDFEWLRNFARQGDQSAFAAVVRRHIDLVYATALRKVQDPGAAQEIAQNVFTVLARKAWQFAPEDSLPAWLYRTALLEAKQWVRAELRRRRREQAAAELGTTMKTPDEHPAFRALLPLLDEALLSLREKDRTALLLRYYEGRSLRELGASLGIGEDTAQKRVSGALHRVAQFFQRRGFRSATAPVAAAALENTAVPAPAFVTATVAQNLLQVAPPVLGGLMAAVARVVTLTKAQKVMACLILLTLPALWQWQAARASARDSAQKRSELAINSGTQISPDIAPALPRRSNTLRRWPGPTAPPSQISRRTNEYIIQLGGIVVLPEFRAALLKVEHYSQDRPIAPPVVIRHVVKESQNFEERTGRGVYLSFQLVEIGAENGSVRALENGEETTYDLENLNLIAAGPGEPLPALCLPNVDLAFLADLYAELIDRTVLRHPLLREMTTTLALPAADKAEAARIIERTFQDQGIRAIPDGEKLTLLVPADRASSISAAVEKNRYSMTKAGEVLPPGAIDFRNVELTQAMAIYGGLIGRELVLSQGQFKGSLAFRNQTPLTKVEVIHAFDTLLEWQGLKVVLLDAKRFKVVPLSTRR